MRNIHKHHVAALIYGEVLIEINEDGTETVVPPELICRAKPAVLKHDTMCWVSDDECERLRKTMRDVLHEVMDLGLAEVENVLEGAAEEGYDTISTILLSPDDGILERHILCRHQAGKHVDLVFVHVEVEGEYLLNDFSTLNRDGEYAVVILRMADPAIVTMARELGLLCEDDHGYHIPARVYRSVYWQCHSDDEIAQILSEWLVRQLHTSV